MGADGCFQKNIKLPTHASREQHTVNKNERWPSWAVVMVTVKTKVHHRENAVLINSYVHHYGRASVQSQRFCLFLWWWSLAVFKRLQFSTVVWTLWKILNLKSCERKRIRRFFWLKESRNNSWLIYRTELSATTPLKFIYFNTKVIKPWIALLTY